MKKSYLSLCTATLAAFLCISGPSFAAPQSGETGISSAPFASTAQPAKAYSLDLDMTKYEKQTMHVDGFAVNYRAYTDRIYVAHPVDTTYQTMNIYVPEGYFHDETINGYTADTAPIFLPNTVGGYMPGKAGTPEEKEKRSGGPNAILTALHRGYVVAAPGARGRTTQASDGTYTGKASAFLVDMKAAVRYLRHNQGVLPGDTEKIITNGTSAGGALSSLIGATGNSGDYGPYLKALGAADERDDVFASSVYCPITDLDHADMAYEWMFNGVDTYYQRSMLQMRQDGPMNGIIHGPGGELIALGPGPVLPEGMTVTNRPDNAPTEGATAQRLTADQKKASAELKKAYSKYINSLHLKDEQGRALKLDGDGNGTFKTYIEEIYKSSAQKAIDDGNDLSHVPWLTVGDGPVKSVDLASYAESVTRLKGTPAFDAFDLSSAENQEFGTAAIDKQHFTKYSQEHSTVSGSKLADKVFIKEMNPLNYIGKDSATVARHWRIRHGAADRDTAIVVPAVLALKLENAGYDVDFASPWGQGHAGDYDLDQLFAWIDSICK